VSTTSERPPDVQAQDAATGGLQTSGPESVSESALTSESEPVTLGSLPVGARLILRCRADWRAATVSAFEAERVVLNVASPGGHTYRVRRPSDSPLAFDGGIPVLGEGCWRAGLARYDLRW
jgi:hypothetical protein